MARPSAVSRGKPIVESLGTPGSIAVIFACTLVILIFGPRLTHVVDQFADRTGWGEALAGALLLGAATSMPGSVLSVTAAWEARPHLAVSNALGGIAVQTFFLAVADLAYRRANLEHAAASLPNMMQNGLLIVILTLIALGPHLPNWTILGIHPLTAVLFGVYVYGIHLVSAVQDKPMWSPAWTKETRTDEPEAEKRLPSTQTLVSRLLPLVAALAGAGWFMERAAGRLVETSGIDESTVGLLITAVCTSLPELVTAVAAVRQGALTLAVGGIIGGNAYDTLFTAASDIAYREGSIYHTIGSSLMFWVLGTLLMSGVLMMGLLRREERGLARIGVESATIIFLYMSALVLVLTK